MTRTLTLEIQMVPVAKGRPRMARSGAVYTPQATRRAEATVSALVRRAYTGKPYDGPLSVSLTFWMPRPKRCPRTLPTVKPDLDNLAKLILDACNGLVWIDDSQIVHLVLDKNYATAGGQPGVSMTVDFWGM